ncbi:hypothetical protein SDC9_123550 [bioreactor metagenome]|uniref:Uncharacterized protein n=1 Tax=bioreactor metagenome TaxID=1076179 RepID=A0A645CHZ1_9ZZZZ
MDLRVHIRDDQSDGVTQSGRADELRDRGHLARDRRQRALGGGGRCDRSCLRSLRIYSLQHGGHDLIDQFLICH